MQREAPLWNARVIGYDPGVAGFQREVLRRSGGGLARHLALRKSHRLAVWFFGMVILGICTTGCSANPGQSLDAPVPKATATTRPSTLQPATITPEPNAPSACDKRSGELVERSYTGVIQGQELPYLAYLPPCYATEAEAYPVVYLLHGYPYDQNHWLDLDLIATYEAGRAQQGWPGVIFILPFAPEPLFTRTDGGTGSYEQEFMEGLVPTVAAEYRTLASAGNQVIGGVSRGGVWALEIGLRNAARFGHILAISPALVYNQPRPQYDPFEIVRDDVFPGWIFLSAAENETPFREEIEAFVRVLEREQVNHTFFLHSGNHNDQSWRAMMDVYLTQLFIGFSN